MQMRAQKWIFVSEIRVQTSIFELCDFFEWDKDTQYDVIFSLATHQTIDMKYRPRLKDHFSKIWKLLSPKGILFFECHYADKDSEGIRDSQAYFDILAYKVMDKFVPTGDIDKLVLILRKKDFSEEFEDRFNLQDALKSRSFN